MSIELQNVTRRIGGRPVVQDVSLEIGDGELFVLLGPSGSGKSTILRMIAGLAPVDSGRVVIHGNDLTAAPPQNREVGFVFQNYALFRHMTAGGNVGFGLKVRGVDAATREQRVEELLDLVGLAGLGNRFPRQLSGGQQQRVALARALACRPSVLLLDEPFGALDQRIREELRRSVKRIQRDLGLTTVFVTHDQGEAFELADRVGLLEEGRLVEVASPRELYMRPETERAARFVGNANLFVVSPGVSILSETSGAAVPLLRDRPFELLFRPEDVAVKDSPAALAWPLLGRATVESSEFFGSYERLRLRLPAIPGVRVVSPRPEFGADTLVIEAHRSGHQARRFPLASGSDAWVGVRRVHALEHHALRLAVLTDVATGASRAVQFAMRIARPAHAHVTLIGRAAHVAAELAELSHVKHLAAPEDDAAWNRFWAEREFDLVIADATAPAQNAAVQSALRNGTHHLLLVGADEVVLPQALIAVTPSEWGKAVVAFAARLLRHLRWEATVLTALENEERGTHHEQFAHDFLTGGARSLALFGVAAKTEMVFGAAESAIERALTRTRCGLLVMGTPPPDAEGDSGLGPLLPRYLSSLPASALLLVRTTVQRLDQA